MCSLQALLVLAAHEPAFADDTTFTSDHRRLSCLDHDQATGSLSAVPVSAARVSWVSLVAADGRSIPMRDGLQVVVCVKNRSICKGQSRVSTGTQTPGHPRSSPPALRPTGRVIQTLTRCAAFCVSCEHWGCSMRTSASESKNERNTPTVSGPCTTSPSITPTLSSRNQRSVVMLSPDSISRRDHRRGVAVLAPTKARCQPKRV